jgi:hypothetical protein
MESLAVNISRTFAKSRASRVVPSVVRSAAGLGGRACCAASASTACGHRACQRRRRRVLVRRSEHLDSINTRLASQACKGAGRNSNLRAVRCACRFLRLRVAVNAVDVRASTRSDAAPRPAPPDPPSELDAAEAEAADAAAAEAASPAARPAATGAAAAARSESR